METSENRLVAQPDFEETDYMERCTFRGNNNPTAIERFFGTMNVDTGRSFYRNR